MRGIKHFILTSTLLPMILSRIACAEHSNPSKQSHTFELIVAKKKKKDEYKILPYPKHYQGSHQ